MATDIADPASVAALFSKVTEKYGHADVLVNNAGIFNAIAPIKDVDQAAWWEELVWHLRLAMPHHLRHNTNILPRPSIYAAPSS